MDDGPGPLKPVHLGGKGVKYLWDFDLINQVQLFPMLWDPNNENWKNEKLKVWKFAQITTAIGQTDHEYIYN